MLLKLERAIDKFSDLIGYLSAILMVLMMFNVFYDVVMRYFFQNSSIAFQELEWHLFSLVFLFGTAYALKEEAHVRVDLIYERLLPKRKAIINIVGTVIFLIPFSLLISLGSIEFVVESYELGEISGDPGGLTHRYLIKSSIVVAFIFVIISSIGFALRNINIYRGIEKEKPHNPDDDVL